ncbi:MAG: DUF4363 family protein [Emergencia sp.]|nr:DUF4363 family protein [Emergencia sp.]
MRSLWISILSIAILIGSWSIFYHYSDNKLEDLIDQCSESVMPAILDADWEKAEEEFRSQYDAWHKYRKYALYFSDTLAINDTDATIAKTLMYIRAKDDSNSSGELLAFIEQLKYLRQTEKVLPENIL